MPLLKHHALVSDTWMNAGAEGELPKAGDVIVPFARLLKEWGELSARDGQLGVHVANTDRPEALATFELHQPSGHLLGCLSIACTSPGLS